MPSDDERREVAARLRNFEQLRDVFRALNVYAFCDVLGVGYMDWEHICARLADLIDLPTCRNVSGCQDVFECSECRCGAELVTEVCNEYGDPFHVPLMPSFCPNCGAMVVEKEEDNG